METTGGDSRRTDSFESPEAMLGHLRAQRGWSDQQREAFLGELVARFPADRVVAMLGACVEDLDGPDGEAVLRLIEVYPEPWLLDRLVAALLRQPDLKPERAWEALAILEGRGRLGREPMLLERWDEINEILSEGDPVLELIEQIEGDPEGPWLAVEGLGAIEPELRAEIVAGLAGHALGSGVLAFLRMLVENEDTATRDAARAILNEHDRPAARLAEACQVPVASPRSPAAPALPGRRSPTLARSLVTAVDGLGCGTIVLCKRSERGLATAVYACDLVSGIRAVEGDLTTDEASAEDAFAAIADMLDREVVENAHELAIGLLAGCLTLSGPKRLDGLDHWLALTVGPELRPRPFPAAFPGWDPASLSFEEMPRRAAAVLEACPNWIDTSPLTIEMAAEIRLREGPGAPDPRRDVGAYRYLFEHGLRGRLELYRRMLLWMAWFWRCGGQEEQGRSALALACQLADAQHVVPGHPFTVELTTRSLVAAQARLAL